MLMSKKKKPGWIIPKGEKLAMVLGAGATASMSTFVSNFLSIYLLMVGIDPTIAAFVLLFLKAWDAVSDIVFGYMVDKYRFKPGENRLTRWIFRGRYMPWFRILFLFLPAGTVIMFTINTDLPLWIRIVQYVLGYILYDLGMTVNAAYNLLPLSVTNNMDERTFVLSWNGLGQGFGALPVVFWGTVFIAGSLGYDGAAMVFAVLGIFLGLIPAVFVKERNGEHEIARTEEKYTIKAMLLSLKQVPELLLMLLADVARGIFYTAGYDLFVCYYIFENPNLSIILTLFGTIPTIVLVPLLPLIFRKVDKIVVARIACITFVIASIAIYGLGTDFIKENIWVLYLCSLVKNTSYTMTLFSTSQLMMDIMEIAKYRTKRDMGGIISAVQSFEYKLVGSLVTSLTLLILGTYGFVSVEAGSFEELAALNAQGIGLQTESALQGLWDISYLFPMIGFAVATVFYFLVKVKRKKVTIYMQVNGNELTQEEGEKLLAEFK